MKQDDEQNYTAVANQQQNKLLFRKMDMCFYEIIMVIGSECVPKKKICQS